MRLTRTVFVFTALYCLLRCSPAFSASFEARVDTDTVVDGESFILEVNGAGLSVMPDFNSWLRSFTILDYYVSRRGQSTVDGASTFDFTIHFELQPRSSGSVTIPAFSVDGVSTVPVVVSVVPADSQATKSRKKVFVEVSVDNDSPYVQEQIVYTIKIFLNGDLVNVEPNLTGNSEFQIESFPSASSQVVQRNGSEYQLQTIRYALFPQKSGELTIEPVIIPAIVRDQRGGTGSKLRSPPLRRIQLTTKPLTIQVKPRALQSTSSWWLPVQALELKHKWSADIKEARVGEPFTYTLELLAKGATASQLPEIVAPAVPGLKIYADEAQQATGVEEGAVISRRREKWSVIPNRAGPVTLPEIVVKWWDTSSDKEQKIVIAAQQLMVNGAQPDEPSIPISAEPTSSDSHSQPAQDADASAKQETLLANTAVATGSSTLIHRNRLWQSLALFATVAWLATMFAWWWSARFKRKSPPAKENSNTAEALLFTELKAASRKDDTAGYSAAVIKWAQVHWQSAPVHNLPEVGIRLGSRELTARLRQLDSLRFSGNKQKNNVVSLNDIQNQLEGALRTQKSKPAAASDYALPQL